MLNYSHPCALLMNDMHISKDNIQEFKDNWNEAVSICEEREFDLIVVGGDLFQSRASQTLDVLLAVQDCLFYAARKGIHVVFANGNHDKVNQEALRGYCHIYSQHGNVTVADEYITIGNEEGWAFVLHLMAYFPESGSFENKLEHLKANGMNFDKMNYLYIHEGVNGALAHSSDKELTPEIFKEFERTFVGHYHNRCQIEGTNIEYIGSSRQHNFGEDEEKGYTILYRDGSTEFVKNKVNKRYRVIDVPVDKVDIHLTDQLAEIKADGRYKIKLRVHSHSSKASGIDKNKLLEAGASKVEIITEEVAITEINSSGFFEKFDSRNLQENYVAFAKEREIENVELGLSYLQKINL